MSEAEKDLSTQVRETISAIIADGKDVRVRVSTLVTDTAERFHLDRSGLHGLARSIVEETTSILDKSVPADADSVLRQTIDGLGDGLAATALASQLALEEAKATGKRFADQDLRKLRDDLKTVTDMFEQIVMDALRKGRTVAGDELDRLRQHAQRARSRFLPTLTSALAALEQQPLTTAKETVQAGMTASRLALGSLFQAAGRRLQDAGKMLAGESK